MTQMIHKQIYIEQQNKEPQNFEGFTSDILKGLIKLQII